MEASPAQHLKARRWRKLVRSLASMRTTEKSDITLTCGSREFPVHKVVLEASSPYFTALFSGAFEFQEAKSKRLAFMGMTPETLGAILDYIYVGDVSKIVTEEELKKVAQASRLMMLDDLCRYCCHALLAFLSTENFFEIFELNQKADPKNIRLKLLYFWIANATKLVASDEFLTLSAENVKELLNFLRFNHSRLNIVLVGLLRWLCHDMEARELFVDELFACVDARLVSKDCVTLLVKDPVVKNISPKLADVVAKLGAACSLSDSLNIMLPVAIEKPLPPCPVLLTYFSDFRIISVFDPSENQYSEAIENFKCIQQFDLTNMSWLSLKTNTAFQSCASWSYIPMCQYSHSVCMIGGILGLNGSYDLQVNSFKPNGCVHFSGGPDTKMCFFKNRLFAIGYSNSGKLQNSVHCSNPGSNCWRKVQPLNYYQSIATVLASLDHIYVIGDMTEEGMVIEYSSDPTESHNEWTVIHIQKSGMDPRHFFVLNKTLHALFFCPGVIKHLVYDHGTKRFAVRGFYHTNQNEKQAKMMKLSHFQNPESPFVFFSKIEDPFFLPAYAWDYAKNAWSVLPPVQGQCHIPCHTYTKMVYGAMKEV